MVLDLVLLLLFVVVLISTIGISFGFSFKYYLNYKDRSNLRVLLIMTYFDIWLISRIFLILNPILDFLTTAQYIMIYRFFDLLLIAGILTLSYIFNNPIFGESTRVFSVISLVLFSGAGFLILHDIFFHPTYLIFGMRGKSLILQLHWAFTLNLMVGSFSLIVAHVQIMSSLSEIPQEPSTIRFNQTNQIISITLFVIGIALILGLFRSSFQLPIKQMIFGIIAVIALFILVLTYNFYRQPLIQFNMGVSAKLLVEERHIGYLIGAITDQGPTTITSSKEFNLQVGLDKITIDTINVSGTTILGINQDYSQKVAIIPVFEKKDYSTILFTFMTKYEGITDKRMKDSTGGLFGIIVPSRLLVNLTNFKNAKNELFNELDNYATLNEFIENEDLNEITIRIMNNLVL